MLEDDIPRPLTGAPSQEMTTLEVSRTLRAHQREWFANRRQDVFANGRPYVLTTGVFEQPWPRRLYPNWWEMSRWQWEDLEDLDRIDVMVAQLRDIIATADKAPVRMAEAMSQVMGIQWHRGTMWALWEARTHRVHGALMLRGFKGRLAITRVLEENGMPTLLFRTDAVDATNWDGPSLRDEVT